MEGDCKVDLNRLDTYDEQPGVWGEIPDEDMTTTLKVLRTVRNWSLALNGFNAGNAVLFSHAIASLHALVKEVLDVEADPERRAANDALPKQVWPSVLVDRVKGEAFPARIEAQQDAIEIYLQGWDDKPVVRILLDRGLKVMARAVEEKTVELEWIHEA